MKEIPSKSPKATTLNAELHEKKVVDFQEENVEVEVERITDLLREIRTRFQETIQSMADIIKEQSPPTTASTDLLQGQRQTLEELD